jgi:hypothetical protein
MNFPAELQTPVSYREHRTFDGRNMTPWDYAQRYLPVTVSGPTNVTRINVSRYHLGAPTAAQQQLLGAVIDHFASRQRKDPSYRLKLIVNDEAIEIKDRQEIARSLQVPFLGKGSPEDCQIVLQLALLVGGITPDRLQAWSDANLGLDCNGFVGNYLFHEVLQRGWRVNPTDADVGPSSTIDVYFKRWAEAPIDDLAKVQSTRMHLIVRVNDAGVVIPRLLGSMVGHIAITQPGEVMNQSFVFNSMGGLDLQTAQLGMYGKLALRTVESAGPIDGVGKNWLVFVKPTKVKGVFEVNRDKIHFVDKIKIAPLRLVPL